MEGNDLNQMINLWGVKHQVMHTRDLSMKRGGENELSEWRVEADDNRTIKLFQHFQYSWRHLEIL